MATAAPVILAVCSRAKPASSCPAILTPCAAQLWCSSLTSACAKDRSMTAVPLRDTDHVTADPHLPGLAVRVGQFLQD